MDELVHQVGRKRTHVGLRPLDPNGVDVEPTFSVQRIGRSTPRASRGPKV